MATYVDSTLLQGETVQYRARISLEALHVDQSVPGRLLDFCTITMRGTGTTLEPISNISAPLELRKQFMQAADLYRQKVK